MSHIASKDELRRMVEALTGVKVGDQLDELPTDLERAFAGFVPLKTPAGAVPPLAAELNGAWCCCADEGETHPSDCICSCHVKATPRGGFEFL